MIFISYNHSGDDMKKIKLKNTSSKPIILIIILLILNILLVISKLDFNDTEIQAVFNYSTSTLRKERKNNLYNIVKNITDVNITKPETIIQDVLGVKNGRK